MADDQPLIEVFLDLRPNQPRDVNGRERIGSLLRQAFEDRLSESVERVWDLPPIMLAREGDYLPLLLEARELYALGLLFLCRDERHCR